MPPQPILTGVVLAVSLVARLTALIASSSLTWRAGRFRPPWGALAAAMLAALIDVLIDGVELFEGQGPRLGLAISDLAVSLLFAWGMLGVRGLIADLERTRDELYEEATRDELTNLSNRRHVMLMARHEAERARRTRRALTLLLLDIDHFKEVNDSLGHERGDEVLKSVTDTCAGELRASDLFGRIGGDEFLIVLPEQGPEAARLVAERLRTAVEHHCTADARRARAITISIGAASVPAGDLPAEDLVTTALARADDALYRAKQEGRNRVVHAHDASETG